MASSAGGMLPVVANRQLWLAGVMGFAGGLPLLLTLTLLQAWLSSAQASLTLIGLLGLVALPYNVKFLWAPLLDRFAPLGLGRRRGWLVISQLSLSASVVVLAVQDPHRHLWAVGLAALAVALFSATQDIAIDAYRRESLADAEQGLGASMYTGGYRLGMLVVSAGGLTMADRIGFPAVYLGAAAILLAMVAVSLLAPEPETPAAQPASLGGAFLGPLAELVRRRELSGGMTGVLAFILLYKLGDNLAGHMAIPFYLEIGFSNTEIGTIVQFFGLGPLLLGLFAGGALNLRAGLYRALWVAGILQGISTAGFAVLALVGHDRWWLAGVIGFENLAQGMGTAALLALLAYCTDRRFSATQFALLSALAAVPRVVLTAPAGWLATQMGWVPLFVLSALLAVPGLLLLRTFRGWLHGPLPDASPGASAA